ncbi:P-loop containing nucleoside triphosphate hydrolases superfamily protein [Theobroma cacao]|uniref:P-loop containing nucleoside triphosphate hydrolases superfamily protein n=1 Tax=Theobroma cacao TaxID=3641 RepID=A0A061ENF6_THECC|nr:P-loop containing nucleoside triphosphate hydrolases superfamily protein [Theobroma cacao]
MHLELGHGKVIVTSIIAVIGAIAAAAAAASYHRPKSKAVKDQNIIPLLERTESGRVGNLERFSHFVARQLGFADANECPQLCRLAHNYLKKSKDCEVSIFEYFANEPEAETLYVKLMEEFERCILSYFAFHWSQASHMISQVLSVESDKKTKLKDFVMAATRQKRFERVTKDLKVTRVFSTLVEEMKAMERVDDESKYTDVMAPVAHSQRSPILLLMGGGMGAGKSTVLKDILKEPLWAGAAANAVVVEADAFKETDVIYRALSSRGHHNDMLQTAELVHQSSTDAASSLLVTALNEGRDVIMDGTLSWEPFVEQTIAMARNVHKHRYRMGVGYKVAEDGTITENYWEQVEEEEENRQQENGETHRKPYRIELVGVVCDAYLAVVRGIRRAIMVKRAVRVNSQLKSHKMFANVFPRYCQLVDNARLYCTNAVGGPPKLIAWKDGDNPLLIDPDDIKCLSNVSSLNPGAESVYELYTEPSPVHEPGSVWKDIVFSPSRPNIQVELRTCIQRIEKSNIQTQE